jgi:hypothetical protein
MFFAQLLCSFILFQTTCPNQRHVAVSAGFSSVLLYLLTSLSHYFSLDMDIAMDIACTEEQWPLNSQPKQLYCGHCGEQIGLTSCYNPSRNGWKGRWQKITTDDAFNWIYLCKGCDTSLGRVFERLEEFHGEKERQREWNRFLCKELKFN